MGIKDKVELRGLLRSNDWNDLNDLNFWNLAREEIPRFLIGVNDIGRRAEGVCQHLLFAPPGQTSPEPASFHRTASAPSR